MNQLTVADRERRRVGATIRALRQKIGATPDQLAHGVGIARPTLTNIELGHRGLRPELLAALAEALDVPQVAIMWADEDEAAPGVDKREVGAA